MNIQKINDLSKTPYLSGLQSMMLLTTPVVSPAIISPVYNTSKVVVNETLIASLKNYLYNTKFIGPSNKSCYLFGAALAMGTGMLFDGDIENGSGFTSVWSSLYLIACSRGSIKALRYGRVWPLLLSGVAVTNTIAYGKRYVSCQFQ